MTTLSFRVTDEEAARIRECAMRANLTVSAWIRQRLDETSDEAVIQFPTQELRKVREK